MVAYFIDDLINFVLLIITPKIAPIIGAIIGNRKGRRVNPGLVYGVAAGVYIAILVFPILTIALWTGLENCSFLLKLNLVILFFAPIIGGLIGTILGNKYSITGEIKLGALVGLLIGHSISVLLILVFLGPCIGDLLYRNYFLNY